MNSISNNLDFIIFDILNQDNFLRLWPITSYPKLGLAIINFKQKLKSSFPLISNHCSISIEKNQPIPHVIANNHKNARTEASMNPNCIVTRLNHWWPYWLESVYAKGPMQWKISLLWSGDDDTMKNPKIFQLEKQYSLLVIGSWNLWKIQKCARCCCIRRKIQLKKKIQDICFYTELIYFNFLLLVALLLVTSIVIVSLVPMWLNYILSSTYSRGNYPIWDF